MGYEVITLMSQRKTTWVLIYFYKLLHGKIESPVVFSLRLPKSNLWYEKVFEFSLNIYLPPDISKLVARLLEGSSSFGIDW